MKICSSDEIIDKSGIELTPHRKSVLDIMSQSPHALSPKMILKAVSKKQSMDKVTLYRILDLFVTKRILRRIPALHGSLHYEIICEEHHPMHPHFVCRLCGMMECLSEFDFSDVKNNLKKTRALEAEDIDLKLEGTCARCKKKVERTFYAKGQGHRQQ